MLARPVAALLAAEVISTTGTEVTAIALPWFVLVTTGSPARMGLVLGAGYLGMTLLGIPSGRLATALGPRRTMLLADAACAPVVALIPLLHWAGHLTFPVVVFVAFIVGAAFPAYTSSQSIVLASLVGEDENEMVRASGLLGAFNETASFVGPAAGGALVAVFGAAPILLIDAASFAVAFALVGLLVPVVAGARPDPTDRQVRDAIRYVRNDRALRRQVVGLAVVGIGFAAMIASVPIAARRRYHASAQLAGWLLAAYGAGSVAGGLVTARARPDTRNAAIAGTIGLPVSTWPMLAPLPSYGLGLAIAANGFCSGLVYPRFFAALTLRTPPPLRARVSAAVNTALSATSPVGFVAAGLIMQHVASLTAVYSLVVATASVGAATALSALGRPRAHPAGSD